MTWLDNAAAACADLFNEVTITAPGDTTDFCIGAHPCFDVYVKDKLGAPLDGVAITKEIRGANAEAPKTEISLADGYCDACIVLSNAGVDSIFITAEKDGIVKKDTLVIRTFGLDDDPILESCPKEVCVYLDANGHGTLPVDSFKCEVIDPCNIGTLTVSQTAYSCADLAEVLVDVKLLVGTTLIDKDRVKVIVKDTFAPNITCLPAIKGFLGGDGKVIIDSLYLTNQGFDFMDNDANSCGVAKVLLNGQTEVMYNCADLGTFVNVTVSAEDASGNIATCETVIEIIDNESPKLTCPEVATIDIELGPDGLDTFIISESGLFSGTDNCGPVSYSPDTIFFSCDEIGTWSKKITMVDPSGNDATCYQNFTIADVSAPNIVCKYPIAGPDTLRLYLDIYGKATLVPDSLDGGTMDACSEVTYSAAQTEFTCLDITPARTALAINLYAVDEYGNIDSCQSIVQVLDTIPPLVFCKDSIMVTLDTMGNATLEKNDFFGLIKDECGMRDTTVSRTTFNCQDVGQDVYVDVTVTDNGGRTSTCEVKVIVKDDIAPVIECVEKYTLVLDVNGKASLSFGDIATIDKEACDLDTTYVDQTDFFCSSIGTYTVKAVAVDASGNRSMCETEVTVVDNMSPTTICKNITVLVGDGGQVTIDPNEIDNGSFDNCGITTKSVHPKTFDCSYVGQTVEVTLTTTDNSGNSSSCRAWVTVAESSLPKAVCHGEVVVQLDEHGNGSIELEDVDAGSSIACNSPNIELKGRTQFTCEDIKNDSIKVTLIVTDASGNVDSCHSKIIVEDNIAPDARCAPGVFNLTLGLSGTATLPVSFIDFGSSDACGIETIMVQPNAFTCDNLGENEVALIVIDSSGNADTCSRIINVVNSVAPNLSCKDITVYLDEHGMVSITPDSVVDKSGSDCFGNIALALSKSDFSCEDIGANTVTLSLASGDYNNSCTATVTVLDTLGPIVHCNSDITVEVDAWGIARVNLADVLGEDATSDNCGVKDTIFTEALFYCDDIFTSPKPVEVTVTDSSGNATTCTTNVTIVDNIDPVITDTPADTVLSPIADCKAHYTFAYPTFEDNCDVVDTIVTSSDTDVVLEMRNDSLHGVFKFTTTITFTIKDASGNEASSEFKIAVKDDHDPTFGNTCPTYPTQYVEAGQCGINFVPTNLAYSDNCGVDTYVCTYRLPDGSIFTTPPTTAPVFLPIGVTTVSHVITDFAGNSAECTYTLEVVDNEAPSIKFNNNFPGYQLAGFVDGDTLNIPYQDNVPLFTPIAVDTDDNCGIASVTFVDSDPLYNNACDTRGYDRLYECIWTATDVNGNSTSITLFVRVECPTVNTPDLQPNFTFGPTSFQNGQSKMVIININEINNGPTTGAIRFFLPKSSGFTYAFDAAQTSATIFAPESVNNPDWSVQNLPTGLLFTSTKAIDAGGRSRIGIRVTADVSGSKASMTANVSPNAGGESRTDNNVAVLSQSVQN